MQCTKGYKDIINEAVREKTRKTSQICKACEVKCIDT